MTHDLQHPPQEPGDSGHRALSDSDASLARVTEDLIDILIARGLIQFTDFPPAAQAKLLERRQTRAMLNPPLKLLDDGDGLI